MDWTGKRVLAPGFYDFFLEEIGKSPGNYMETGVFEGWGLRELALKYPDRTFFGIDPFIEDGYTTGHSGVGKHGTLSKEHEIAVRNLKLPNAYLYVMDSTVFRRTQDITGKDFGISFFFVDGRHDYESASSDLRLALDMMVDGGVIGIDDLGLKEVGNARNDFVDELGSRLDYVSDVNINNYGDLIYIKPL